MMTNLNIREVAALVVQEKQGTIGSLRVDRNIWPECVYPLLNHIIAKHHKDFQPIHHVVVNSEGNIAKHGECLSMVYNQILGLNHHYSFYPEAWNVMGPVSQAIRSGQEGVKVIFPVLGEGSMQIDAAGRRTLMETFSLCFDDSHFKGSFWFTDYTQMEKGNEPASMSLSQAHLLLREWEDKVANAEISSQSEDLIQHWHEESDWPFDGLLRPIALTEAFIDNPDKPVVTNNHLCKATDQWQDNFRRWRKWISEAPKE